MGNKVPNTTLNAIVSIIIYRDYFCNELRKYIDDEDKLLTKIKERLYLINVAFDEDDPAIARSLSKDEIDNPDWDAIFEVCYAFLRPKENLAERKFM